MFDEGSQLNVISTTVVERLGLQMSVLQKPQAVRYPNNQGDTITHYVSAVTIAFSAIRLECVSCLIVFPNTITRPQYACRTSSLVHTVLALLEHHITITAMGHWCSREVQGITPSFHFIKHESNARAIRSTVPLLN